MTEDKTVGEVTRHIETLVEQWPFRGVFVKVLGRKRRYQVLIVWHDDDGSVLDQLVIAEGATPSATLNAAAEGIELMLIQLDKQIGQKGAEA